MFWVLTPGVFTIRFLERRIALVPGTEKKEKKLKVLWVFFKFLILKVILDFFHDKLQCT